MAGLSGGRGGGRALGRVSSFIASSTSPWPYLGNEDAADGVGNRRVDADKVEFKAPLERILLGRGLDKLGNLKAHVLATRETG